LPSARSARHRSTSPAGVGWEQPESKLQKASYTGHYLAASSPYRDAGDTGINATLRKDLAKMTTYPPLAITVPWTNSMVLSPQAAVDSDIPDMGYHYIPLDFYFTGLPFSNATVTLTNGVALAVYGATGLQVGTAAVLQSEGIPNRLNRIVRQNTVQELPTAYAAGGSLVNIASVPAVRPTFDFRFTDFPAMAGSSGARTLMDTPAYYGSSVSLTDCQLRGTILRLAEYPSGTGLSVQCTLKNCLAERSTLYLGKYWFGLDVNFTANLWNNTFWNGTVTLNYDTDTTYNPAWTVKDNLFDAVSLSQGGTGITNIVKSNNGYQSTTSLGGTGNVTLSGFTYATGPLGPWYQGETSLVDLGSRTAAAAGLYQETTRTSLAKEAGTTVDIGFLPGLAFPTTEGQFGNRAQAPHEALHRRVVPGESMVGDQILVDPLGREPLLDGHADHRAEYLALAATTGHRAGGRNGRVCLRALSRQVAGAGGRNGWIRNRGLNRAGGRNGRVCPTQMAADGLAVDAQLAGYAPPGPTLRRQGFDRFAGVHAEVIHRRDEPRWESPRQ